MANNLNNIVVGKPLVTGGILIAPTTVVLPTDATMALTGGANGFASLGYITDAGVTKSEKRNTGVLYAWGGDTIAATKKGMDVTFKFDMAELLNSSVQSLTYGTQYVGTSASVAALGVVPTLTVGTASAGGSFAAGTYYWAATWITSDGGESKPSAIVNATLTANQQQALTLNATPAGASGWNLYRSADGGITWVLVTAGGTGTTTTDSGTAGTAALLPSTDTTGKGNRMTVRGTSATTPKKAWVFEIFSDPQRLRIVVPSARVMDVGDTVYKDDSVAAAQVTLQAFPVNGTYFYQYSDDGTAVVY